MGKNRHLQRVPLIAPSIAVSITRTIERESQLQKPFKHAIMADVNKMPCFFIISATGLFTSCRCSAPFSCKSPWKILCIYFGKIPSSD